MRRLSLLAVLWLALASSVMAQQEEPQQTSWLGHLLRLPAPYEPYSSPSQRSYTLGYGSFKLRDSYLSPLEYTGYSLSVSAELISPRYKRYGKAEPEGSLFSRRQRRLSDRWVLHNLARGVFASTTNPSITASTLYFSLEDRLSWLRRLSRGVWGDLLLGGGAGGSIGGLYHSRNGNNPSTAKFGLSLTLAGLYSYRLPVEVFPMHLKLYASIDLLGVMFSSEYGESYYEMYETEALKKRFYLSYPSRLNRAVMRLTLDLPVMDWAILSLGYHYNHYGSHINHLETQLEEHALCLGLTFYTLPLGGRVVQQGKKYPLAL